MNNITKQTSKNFIKREAVEEDGVSANRVINQYRECSIKFVTLSFYISTLPTFVYCAVFVFIVPLHKEKNTENEMKDLCIENIWRTLIALQLILLAHTLTILTEYAICMNVLHYSALTMGFVGISITNFR